MKRYSSGRHKYLTADPKPWVGADGSRRSRYSRFAPQKAPRPEFNRPLTNEQNPILTDVRLYRRELLAMNNPKGWDHILRKFEQAVGTTGPWSDATPEHVEHARAVLTRLTELSSLSGVSRNKEEK